MAYGLGFKLLNSMCAGQNPLAWHKAKLSVGLFKINELPAFLWVEAHLAQFHSLPALPTLYAQFPDFIGLDTPEPSAYYVAQLEIRYFYDQINQANIQSQNILGANHRDHKKAREVLRLAENSITQQEYRNRIVNVGAEGGELQMKKYWTSTVDATSVFGWPYLDEQAGGARAGEVVSIVGRPSTGKTILLIYSAIENWKKGKNVLFVSMEMEPDPILDRVSAIYTRTPISQLMVKGFSTQTYKRYEQGLLEMKGEAGRLFVMDGNLAANVEDIYTLADQFECQTIMIDGAYLVRHKNAKLDRFNRTAENVELIKRHSSSLHACTFASWQFNREASKKKHPKDKAEVTIDEIGYSDAIGQISSIVLGLFQSDGVANIPKRDIRLLKGRNGEIGQFSVAWNFQMMDFSQVAPTLKDENKGFDESQWL
jgi:replicative DNA helicase